MRRGATVLLTSLAIGFCSGVLLASALFRNLQAALIGGVLFGAPLGLIGGFAALFLLHSGKAPSRDRWAGRGSLLGVGIGAMGAALWPLLVGQYTLAGLYALLGAIGGALAGGTTAALLRRLLADDETLPARSPIERSGPRHEEA